GIAVHDDRAPEVLDEAAARVHARLELAVVLEVEAGLDLVRADRLHAMERRDPGSAPLFGIAREPTGAADRVGREVVRTVRDERIRIAGAVVEAARGRGSRFAAERGHLDEVDAVQLLQRYCIVARVERAAVERRAVPRRERLDLRRTATELRGPARH